MERILKLLWDSLTKAFSLFVIILLLISTIFFIFLVLGANPPIPIISDRQLVEQVTHEWKFNEPLYVQYIDYVVKSLTGNLHTSIAVQKGVPINHFIGASIERTLFLMITVGFLSILLGATYESIASRHSGKAVSKLMHLIALIFWSTPAFALIMLILMANNNGARWLPIGGDGTGFMLRDAPIQDKVWSFLQHAFLPVLTGVLVNFGFFVFIVRGGRALQPEHRPVYKRGTEVFDSLRKMPWFVMFFFAWLMTSVLLIELVYNYHGLGLLLWQAISLRDNPTTIATFYVIGIIVVIANFSYRIAFPTSGKSEPLASRLEPESSRPANDAQKAASVTMLARRVLINYLRSRSGILALIIFAIFVLVAVAAPVISTVRDPEQIIHLEPSRPADNWLNPLSPSLNPSPYTGLRHLLGTDVRGADVYSMILYGGGGLVLSTVLLSMISFVFGILSGFIGAISLFPANRAAKVLGWIFREIGSTFVSIPLFVILACSVAAFYRTPWVLSSGLPFPIAVLIYSWAWMFVAYDVRDEAIRIKGERKGKRPSANELLPRILKRTLFVTKYVTMTGMLVIVSLSFFGVMPPESHSSWGQMLEASYEWNAPLAGHWWLIIPALVAIALFVMCTFVIIDRLEASVDLETSEQRSTAAESRITAA